MAPSRHPSKAPPAGSIHKIVCEDCKTEVSGPNMDAVTKAMGRHEAKTGHARRHQTHTTEPSPARTD